MTEQTEYSFVAYTDGSARPTNPGYGGSGIHGYLYSNQPTNKGIGNTDWFASEGGYKKKKDHPGESSVNIVKYIDISKPLVEICDNTEAETTAFIAALTTAPEALKPYKISKYTIISDHEGVVSGANGLLERWEGLGWRKTNGQPLAQLELKKKMLEVIRQVKTTAALEVKWVKGHSGDLGNDSADKLAAVAANRRIKGEFVEQVAVTDPNGYWGFDHDRHPLLGYRTMYMTTIASDHQRGCYFLGSHGKDDKLVGSSMADGFFVYLRLNEPDLVLEMIRDMQVRLADGECRFAMVHLDTVVSKKVYADLSNYGESAITRNVPERDDLWCIGGVPITRVLEPALLGYTAISNAHVLKQILDNYEGDKEGLTETDVTDTFFSRDGKGGVVVNKSIPQGSSTLWVKASAQSDDGAMSIRIPALMGSSMPSRNQLKGLEKENPKVICLTWSENKDVYRYAFVIKTDKATACTTAIYTNVFFAGATVGGKKKKKNAA